MSDTDKAAPDKGAAARSEKNGTPKQITWRKLKIKLPDEMPGTLLFTIYGDTRGPVFANLALLDEVLGPDQFASVRQKIADDGLSIGDTEDAVDNLAAKVLAKYGMTEGESEASPES